MGALDEWLCLGDREEGVDLQEGYKGSLEFQKESQISTRDWEIIYTVDNELDVN